LLSENLSGRLSSGVPDIYSVLVVAGSNAAWQEARAQLSNLTSYVEGGGKLVLHRPDSAFLAAAQPVLFPDLDFTDTDLSLILRRTNTDAVTHLVNHDLYWIDQAGDWNKPELLSTNIAHRFYHQRFNLTNYSTIQVASMPIHSAGGANAGGWLLWANGYVAQTIYAAQAGTYLFNVSASGTPALGGWPQMTLKIDGRAQDTVTVSTGQLAFYSLSADLTAGNHEVAISFDNDAYAPPEDRNLFLAQILWGRADDNAPASLLTQPGAVAQVRRGKGVIVLDEIAWDTESQNATKANRFACELLTGLGAALRVPPSFSFQAVNMSNINVAAYSVAGEIAWLNSGGRIETTVRFTSSGSYTFQVVAGGTPAQGILPLIGITVDGTVRTNFFLNSAAMTSYSIELSVGAGTHKIGLAFLNDLYAPPDDRNAAFGALSILPATPPRITFIGADPLDNLATLQWEGIPGKTYEVQIASNLFSGFESVVSVTNTSAIASWQDAGGTWGVSPFTQSSLRRYYRIRQSGP
jgi:hypothetical protein